MRLCTIILTKREIHWMSPNWVVSTAPTRTVPFLRKFSEQKSANSVNKKEKQHAVRRDCGAIRRSRPSAVVARFQRAQRPTVPATMMGDKWSALAATNSVGKKTAGKKKVVYGFGFDLWVWFLIYGFGFCFFLFVSVSGGFQLSLLRLGDCLCKFGCRRKIVTEFRH